MVQWEYASIKAISGSEDDTVININGVTEDLGRRRRSAPDVLNEMGQVGWELVTILTIRPASSDTVQSFGGIFRYYLKRQR